MLLNVCVSNTEGTIFKGDAKSVILPGEEGVFEILPFHKPILSRLLSGALFIDEKRLRIKRGLVKVNHNNVAIIVEEAQGGS